jgi:SAM-dependent methyltransferase
MMGLELVQVPCPVCGSPQSRLKFQAHDYVHRISPDAFGVRRCTVCSVGFLSPRPLPADLGRFYPEEFFWSHENSPTAPLDAAELLRRRAGQIDAKLERMAHLQPGRLLDIGAMKGEFLHVAQRRGWSVQGVEFSQQPPNLFGVPMRYGEFLDMQFEPQSFDCVTMWAVLEHVYEPQAYVRRVAEVLRTGGTFLGVVTNFNSIHARLLRADDYPRHLTMFTKESLARLLRSAGLRPKRMWTDQKLFGGRLRGAGTYLVKRALGYSIDEALYELRDQRDPELFCCKFRGRSSHLMKLISRLDTATLLLPELLLDRLGLGFNLGFEACKT